MANAEFQRRVGDAHSVLFVGLTLAAPRRMSSRLAPCRQVLWLSDHPATWLPGCLTCWLPGFLAGTRAFRMLGRCLLCWLSALPAGRVARLLDCLAAGLLGWPIRGAIVQKFNGFYSEDGVQAAQLRNVPTSGLVTMPRCRDTVPRHRVDHHDAPLGRLSSWCDSASRH